MKYVEPCQRNGSLKGLFWRPIFFRYYDVKIKGRITSSLWEFFHRLVVGLLAEAAALGELSLASSGLGELGVASSAGDLSASVAVHDGDSQAVGALHVHEVGVGALDQTVALVLLALILDIRISEIGIEEPHEAMLAVCRCRKRKGAERERNFVLEWGLLPYRQKNKKLAVKRKLSNRP
jgi:hypothetical protein